MKKSMKLAAVAACAVAMTAAMIGGTATSAFAQVAPSATVSKATVAYNETKSVTVTFNIKNYNGAEIKCTGVNYDKTKNRNVSVNVKDIKVGHASAGNSIEKVTVTMKVKGTNANNNKDNVTTVRPVIAIAGKNYDNLASAKVTCKKANQKITATASKVSRSSVKKKAAKVSLKVKSTSGKTVKVYKKSGKYVSVKAGKIKSGKSAKLLTMKKHKCGKKTKSHAIKVKMYVAGNKNYNAATKTVSVKVNMK